MNIDVSSADWPRFERVVDLLGMDEEATLEWRTGWPESQALFDEARGAFLTRRFVEETCCTLRMGEEAKAAFLTAQPLLDANDLLRRFAWHCHCRLFRPLANEEVPPLTWPVPPESTGKAGRIFYGFVCLSGVPFLEQRHRALGIDQSVTIETLSDIEVWMRDYFREHGEWGFVLAHWLMNHFRLRVFRLGRLQFEMRTFPLDIHAFRNVKTRNVVVLAGDGARFRRDGQFDGTNNIRDELAWTSTFRADDTVIAGHPLEDGSALKCEVRLPVEEWQPILGIDDPCLSVHIAAEAPLDHDACVASYRQAVEFFGAHFPEHRFRVLYCDSWLLDCQLAEHLPQSSNIVRFQKEWRLVPALCASDAQTIERVFGRGVSDPMAQHASTSLQHCVTEHMKRGKRWRNAAGLIFPEEPLDSGK